MIYHFDQSPIWHVVFHHGRSLWSRRFRHVSLAGYTNDSWLHLDLHRGYVSTAVIYHHDDVQEYLSYLLTHYTVVKFGPSLPRSRQFGRPMTCVNFTKHVLGVRSGALRPDGLFTSLVRDHNAEVINATESPEGNGRAAPATAAG